MMRLAAALLTGALAVCAQPLVTVDFSTPAGISRFEPGVTHTQYTNDSGNAQAVAESRAILSRVAVWQNQHILGWGTLSPEPSPGEFDWRTLDNRMRLIRETGGKPVITLCCAPDWMKGGEAGKTDWSKLETAPLPEHFDDFANLARRVAERYPDVHHFQVWNEFKGFWNRAKNRWNYEAYTDLYNRVYRALKAVNPEIQVGGPYVVVRRGDRRPLDAIEYWLANKAGAEFVVVDAPSYQPDDPVAATAYYREITEWLRSRTDLPVWWAEWYPTPFGTPEQFDHDYQNVIMASALLHMVRGGAAVALRWQPQGVATSAYEGNNQSIWSDVRVPGGGKPFPFARTQELVRQVFPPGTEFFEVHSEAPNIRGLASRQTVLLVNVSYRETEVALFETRITLGGNSVTAVPAPNR